MMFSWVLFTLMAAFTQAWRNAFQKQLSSTVDSFGVTLSRFIFAFPLALIYLWWLYTAKPISEIVVFTSTYWIYIVLAACAQIFATMLMIRLFHQKNYAIGVGLAKSEAILAAILGVTFFGEYLSPIAWCGVMLGAFAIYLLSKGGIQNSKFSWNTFIIGILSGLFFAITLLFVREATLQLDNLPTIYRAAWVLVCVIGLQSILLLLYLTSFKRNTIVKMCERKGLVLAISFTSCLASLGWFTAMSMQTAAIVTTLGQIEMIFSLFISAFFFKEKLVRTDHWGLFWIVIAAIIVIWA
jgi:drug/metabolite transporter (DMT)-like permease